MLTAKTTVRRWAWGTILAKLPSDTLEDTVLGVEHGEISDHEEGIFVVIVSSTVISLLHKACDRLAALRRELEVGSGF